MAKGKPKRAKSPKLGKHPKNEFSSTNYKKETPVWLVRTLDNDGPWNWNKLNGNEFKDTILERIKNFETMTIKKIIDNTGSHSIPITDLIKTAQKRLDTIKQNDLDELFSLRVSGKKRIWCIQSGNRFSFLWWDPEHEVCPSNKRNT